MKLSKKMKAQLPFLGFGLLLGMLGYWLGAKMADPNFVASLREALGIAGSTKIHSPTVSAACLIILMAILQAVVLVLARVSPAFSKASGVEAQFGDGKTTRKSLTHMAWMGSANGLFIALLAFAEVWKLSGTPAVLAASGGLLCGLVICVTGVRVWPILDEMVRRIWVEATALSCGMTLLLGMFWSLGTSLGYVESVTTFQTVLIYNYIYLAVYLVITAIRAPTTFTNPTLEEG
jgi:hypothetical protein